MTLQASWWRLLIRAYAVVPILVVMAIVLSRFYGRDWPPSDFYISALAVATALGAFRCAVYAPAKIVLTDEILDIAWRFNRSVSVAPEELERYGVFGALFVIDLENHGRQVVDPLGFAGPEWQNFLREIERRFPDKKSDWFWRR